MHLFSSVGYSGKICDASLFYGADILDFTHKYYYLSIKGSFNRLLYYEYE